MKFDTEYRHLLKFKETHNVSQIGYMSELPLNIRSRLILITCI